jgi:hypothetical protein
MVKKLCWVLVLAFVLGTTLAQAGEIPEGKFDKDDPEIAVIRELDFENVDYGAEPIKTRVTALLALNELLNRVGERSAARLEMLEAYINDQKLESALMESEAAVPEVERLTFEDGQKIAVAFVKTQRGADMFGPRLPKVPDAGLANYEKSYIKLGRKRWAEIAYVRHRIEATAVFLDSAGKFGEYKKWAIGEEARQREAGEAAYRERVKEEEREAKAKAEEAAERKHELELKRMEYAFKLKQEKIEAAEKAAEASYRSDDKDWNRWGDYYGGHVYRRPIYGRPGRPVTKPKPRPPVARPRPRPR